MYLLYCKESNLKTIYIINAIIYFYTIAVEFIRMVLIPIKMVQNLAFASHTSNSNRIRKVMLSQDSIHTRVVIIYQHSKILKPIKQWYYSISMNNHYRAICIFTNMTRNHLRNNSNRQRQDFAFIVYVYLYS